MTSPQNSRSHAPVGACNAVFVPRSQRSHVNVEVPVIGSHHLTLTRLCKTQNKKLSVILVNRYTLDE